MTIHRDGCSTGYSAWILPTHVILPEGYCGYGRADICQADDEIVIIVTYAYKITRLMSKTYTLCLRKNAQTLKSYSSKIVRIDFDDIWQKYSKVSRIEFACFSFRVGLLS